MPTLITTESISDVVSKLVVQANRYLPHDVLNSIEQMTGHESSPTGRMILDIIQENAVIAANTGLPICQDTGIDVVFIELARETYVEGNLYEAVNLGIATGTKSGWLRSSVCDPITRKNSGNNTPAVVHTELSDKRETSITVLPKGCGSENMSAIFMLPPSAGEKGVVDAVVSQVRKAGPNPCPPGLIGVGIGGTMEQAALISKKALLRSPKKRHAREDVAKLERKIEKEIQNLGNGPQGLGGDISCLGVAVEVSPCHIASLPVAVNVQCHAARSARAIFRDGKWSVGKVNVDNYSVSNKQNDLLAKATRLNLPISKAEIKNLSAGQWVLLNGTVYTGRDQTHRRLVEMLRNNKSLPVDLSGYLLYYTGPSPTPLGMVTGSAGPTTSYRMDSYTPEILDLGVAAVMGKGRRSPEVRSSLQKQNAAYFATIGGAGAYLAQRIKSISIAAFEDLGPEAMFKLELSDFPAIVIIDSEGNDYYQKVLS